MREVQLTHKQKEVAPATTSDLVLMNNGRTLKEELSTSVLDKFSREVTVDTSMSKVIDGTLDGVYESGVMYGRSLVNLSNLHKSFNDVTLSDYYVDTSLCETSKLKLGTPYTLVFYTTVHGGDHDIYGAFELGVGNALHGTNTHPKTTTSYSGKLVKNGWSKKCVTFTDFLGYKYLSLRPIRCNAPESGKSIRFSIEGFILLEGDWSNKDLPFNDYFDGIGYCKMPILRNVGKNLFDVGKVISLAPNKIKVVDEGIEVINGVYDLTSALNISPDKQYTVGYSFERISGVGRALFAFKYEDGSIQYINGSEDGRLSTASHKGKKIKRFELTYSDTGVTRLRKIQLEESSTATTYEDHKTNILHTPETVTLRSLPNGVRDELNLKTGEYIKRIGEIVFDGSEGWAYHSTGTVNGTTAYRYRTNVSNMLITNQLGETPRIFCDKLPCVRDTQEEVWSTVPSILRRIASDYGAIYIVTSASTVNAFKQWLSQNPITVQYELAEPITTIVEPLTIPFAYENGHIILESGSEEQSLLPELKYSVPASKNGVISTTSKAILKHEQRLHKFEDLLLRESILMDYRLTLSFLDKM